VNSPGNLPQIRADTGQTRYDVGDLLLEGAQFAGQRRLGSAQLEAQRDKSLLGAVVRIAFQPAPSVVACRDVPHP
jgi:hypothetical protein